MECGSEGWSVSEWSVSEWSVVARGGVSDCEVTV